MSTRHAQEQEPLMLKRQIELKLMDNWDAVRIWNTIPDRCRQQVVEFYARLIGNAAKAESTTHIGKENVEDGHTDES